MIYTPLSLHVRMSCVEGINHVIMFGRKRSVLVLGLALFLSFDFFGSSAEAKTFSNSYVSFDLPDRWQCYAEHTEWLCRINSGGASDAMIVLTAKESGPLDTLNNYFAFLKQPRVVTGSGRSLPSTVYKVEQVRIANQPWIDGFHFGSEVFNYYTRYMATTKDKLGILVTFSAHKSDYTKYSSDFMHAIATLRVTATVAQINSSKFSDEFLGDVHGSFNDRLEGVAPMEPMSEDDIWSKLFGSEAAKTAVGGSMVAGAIGFYLIFMKRKKKR